MTSEGEVILRAKQARDYIYIDGTGSVRGVISKGIENSAVDITSHDPPSTFQIVRADKVTSDDGWQFLKLCTTCVVSTINNRL